MSATPETDAILEYLRVQFPATEGHLPLREMIQTIVRQRNGVAAKLRELETSIADLTHPNIAELLAKLNAREEDLRLAAGELRVPMPEAGTDMARLLSAKVLLRHQRDEARATCAELVTDSNAITLAETVVRLQRQRDELLAALEVLFPAAKAFAKYGQDVGEDGAELETLLEAISEVEGAK